MNILIRNATLVYPGHPKNGKKLDLFVKNGIIDSIGSRLSPKGKFETVTSKNLHISPGWLDFRAHLGEPGYEERETIKSAQDAAASGGFTAVCATPSNSPVTDNRGAVEYLINKSKGHAVDVLPIGSLSQGMNGTDLSEMYDMKTAGAIAFSDDKKGVQNAKFMQLSLEYARGIDALVMSFPLEEELKGKAEVNEGENSTRLGLKGIPHLAEEIVVKRDVSLVEYTGSKLHFTGLSSGESAQIIAQAKKKGLDISADVSFNQLILNDSTLESFDSNYKLLPPLRTESDRKSLVNQLLKGNIDVICSDHTPHNIENKACEFELASFGSIGFQSFYPSLNTKVGDKINSEVLIEKVAINPRKILGLEVPQISEGEEANMTLFDPDQEWEYTTQNNKSRSENSAFIGKVLRGKIVGVINNGYAVLND